MKKNKSDELQRLERVFTEASIDYRRVRSFRNQQRWLRVGRLVVECIEQEGNRGSHCQASGKKTEAACGSGDGSPSPDA